MIQAVYSEDNNTLFQKMYTSSFKVLYNLWSPNIDHSTPDVVGNNRD